nr:hypothetical protein [Tanacetum cinerariifolium]
MFVKLNHINFQRQFGAFPGDLSPGKRRWGTLVRDSFPNDNPRRKDVGSNSFDDGSGTRSSTSPGQLGTPGLSPARVCRHIMVTDDRR